MVLDDLEIMIDTMDTDLDIAKLTLEQREQRWTQFKKNMETLMASVFI